MGFGRLKRRMFEIIEVAHHGDRASRAFDIVIISLISLNILGVILSTVRSVDAAIGTYLRWFEIFSVIVFTIEYILRVWTSDLKTGEHDPVRGRLRYMASPMAIIDLVAILPFYIPLVTGLDLRFLRAVRLVRLLMLFKANRYSDSMSLLRDVFRQRKGEIGVTFFIVLIMIVLSSGLMYFVENSAQPDKYGSIPEAVLWSVATITSADPAGVYPVTVIMAENDAETVAQFAKRVLVLEQGKIARDAPPRAVFQEIAWLDSIGAPVPPAARLAALLREAGRAVDFLTLEEAIAALRDT